MKKRHIETYLLRDARYYPVLTLTGPRQSGKTTLARATFASYSDVSLETTLRMLQPSYTEAATLLPAKASQSVPGSPFSAQAPNRHVPESEWKKK